MSLSGSDWSSNEDAPDLNEVSSAININFVEHLTQRHPPRVTQRRLTRPAVKTETGESGQEVVGVDEAPRKQQRFDLAAMISSALKKGDVRVLREGMSVEQLSALIVGALRKSSGGGEVARAVTHALLDPLNVELRTAVLKGEVSPEKLVALDEVSLLNPKERAEHEKARLERLSQHSVEYVEKLNYTITHMFTCPACGSRECFANFRSTDFVKWQGDDQTPTLLRCCKCSHSFRQ